jgi:hypothetical protein
VAYGSFRPETFKTKKQSAQFFVNALFCLTAVYEKCLILMLSLRSILFLMVAEGKLIYEHIL